MFISKVDEFFSQNEADVNRGLDKVGRMLKNTIIGNTPVRTGNLQSRNNYDVRDKILTLYNTADYAEFVELGTIFQTANPFMRNSIYQKIDEIRLIMEAELKE